MGAAVGKVITKLKTIIARAVCTCTIVVRCNHSHLRLELGSAYMAHGVMQEAQPITRPGNDKLTFKTVSAPGSLVGTAGLLVFNLIDFKNDPDAASGARYGHLVVAWKVNALSWDEMPCGIWFLNEPPTDFEELYEEVCEKVLDEVPPQRKTDVICYPTQWLPSSLGTLCIRSVACKCKSFKSVRYEIEVEESDKEIRVAFPPLKQGLMQIQL